MMREIGMLRTPRTRAVRRQPIAHKRAAEGRRYIRQTMSLLAVIVLVALFLVWARIQVIQLGYEVSRLRKDVRDLGQRRDLLEADVAKLKSPERLEATATGRFGMRSPMGDEVVVLRRADGSSKTSVAKADDSQ
jgi:cell division protein FtsL